MNPFDFTCDSCGENFDNAFDLIDHVVEDDDEFDPALILPNGIKLMIGSMLRFMYEYADDREQIRQLAQSTYVTLFAAERGMDVVDDLIEDMVVDSEMMKFDATLRALLEEHREEGGE
jgi:hypothetical protein